MLAASIPPTAVDAATDTLPPQGVANTGRAPGTVESTVDEHVAPAEQTRESASMLIRSTLPRFDKKTTKNEISRSAPGRRSLRRTTTSPMPGSDGRRALAAPSQHERAVENLGARALNPHCLLLHAPDVISDRRHRDPSIRTAEQIVSSVGDSGGRAKGRGIRAALHTDLEILWGRQAGGVLNVLKEGHEPDEAVVTVLSGHLDFPDRQDRFHRGLHVCRACADGDERGCVGTKSKAKEAAEQSWDDVLAEVRRARPSASNEVIRPLCLPAQAGEARERVPLDTVFGDWVAAVACRVHEADHEGVSGVHVKGDPDGRPGLLSRRRQRPRMRLGRHRRTSRVDGGDAHEVGSPSYQVVQDDAVLVACIVRRQRERSPGPRDAAWDGHSEGRRTHVHVRAGHIRDGLGQGHHDASD
eukprot:scaffold1102_cov256-Pinguiococcus_pyrenoidosus.AAC.26